MTIQNALDYYKNDNGRAVCLWDQGTKTICKNVRLLSYQDTYYSNLHGAVKYFEDCEIHGTVDFICGDGSVYFKNNLLYCEKRYAKGGGSDALTANNGPATDRGYVFDSCTVMHLADGTVLNPNSNKVTFLDKAPSTETRDIETVLTAQQAATYTMEYTLGSWAATAASDVAQVNANPEAIVADAAYLVEKEGEFVAILTGSEVTAQLYKLGDHSIRHANTRGGFGAPAMIKDSETGMETVTGDGLQVTGQKILRDGILLIEHNGKTYNVLGTIVR